MDFRDYIFKTLRWPLCLVPGPMAAVCLGLARVFNDVVADIEWLRDQFNPATCEAQYLTPLAESRGIKRHRLETDDDKFRQRVVKAFAWQLLGGKSAGMPVLLNHFGYETEEPVNVRSEDAERWAEFRVNVTSPEIITADDYALQVWAINESKPARSKLAAIRYNATLQHDLYTGGVVATGDVHNISMDIDISVEGTQQYAAVAVFSSETITINLPDPSVSVDQTDIYVGGAVQTIDLVTIGASDG